MDKFIFHGEWKDIIGDMPDELKLEFYEAIAEYGITGNVTTELSPMVKLAFSFAKATIDKDNERSNEIRLKRSEAGRKGGAPKGNDNAAKQAKTSKNKQKQAKQAKQANDCFENSEKDNKLNNNELEQSQKQAIDCFTPIVDNSNSSNNNIVNDNILILTNDTDIKEKKSVREKKKIDAQHALALLEARREDFYNSLIPFVSLYGKETVRNFYEYWSEFNRSKTKMRCELEKTWNVSMRLRTWASRDNNFKSRNNGADNSQRSQARAQDAAQIIAELEEEERRNSTGIRKP